MYSLVKNLWHLNISFRTRTNTAEDLKLEKTSTYTIVTNLVTSDHFVL